ncbi:MAG: hypothetical protein HUK19_09495 [Fibrobacter sp.]|nr:hypothetical protein [Fibrobacter sp.]
MKMRFLFFAFLAVAMLFSGCASSSSNIVFDDVTKRKPLAPEDKLNIAFATDLPFVPENSVSIATVRTDPEAQCSAEDAMGFLKKKARQLGANLLYVKKVETHYIFYYLGFVSMTRECQVLYADFLEMK